MMRAAGTGIGAPTMTHADGKEALVETDGLGVAYGNVRALDGVTLSIRPGATGLLGPNGAGKTSLLRVLLGLVRPAAGRVRILGFDPARRRDRLDLRAAVGYLPESECLMPGMSGVELVATLGRISGLARTDAMTRAHEVLDFTGLEEERYREATTYSTGMKQRLKLAQALVHDPPLLLLDEPTNGLDPKGRAQMLSLIDDLARRHGKSVLLCSHLLPDVERICTQVIVLSRGRVAAGGSLAEMTRTEGRFVRAEVGAGRDAVLAALAGRGAEAAADGPAALRLRIDAENGDADLLFAAAAEAGAVILAVEPVRSSLEAVFLRVVEAAGEAGR